LDREPRHLSTLPAHAFTKLYAQDRTGRVEQIPHCNGQFGRKRYRITPLDLIPNFCTVPCLLTKALHPPDQVTPLSGVLPAVHYSKVSVDSCLRHLQVDIRVSLLGHHEAEREPALIEVDPERETAGAAR
jgi:hypothetical protein